MRKKLVLLILSSLIAVNLPAQRVFQSYRNRIVIIETRKFILNNQLTSDNFDVYIETLEASGVKLTEEQIEELRQYMSEVQLENKIEVPKNRPLATRKIEYSFSDYVPVKSPGGTWGYKQYNDLVILPKYQEAGAFQDGLAPVKLGGKYGYIDKEGQNVIPYKFEKASVFSEGLAMVRLNGKVGYIDRYGKQVIPYKYSDGGDFIDGLAEVFFDGKYGFVDKTGEWFSRRDEVLMSFTAYARQYIEKYVNDWQKKGKFEKTADWQKRVNEDTRKKLVDSLLSTAKLDYIALQQKTIKQDYKLGEYDADGEIFLIHDSRFGNLLVPVPIGEAMSFEKEFASVVRKDTYDVFGDEIGLTVAEFVMPSGKSYTYNNSDILEFASVSIDYNFDSIEIDDTSEKYQNNSHFANKSMAVGKSDIDISVPEIGYVNKNTFAVIIANENYQRVSPVEFANNDGEVFMEYCQKTLGVPEKNIRLIKDATLVNMWEQVDWLSGIAKAYAGDAKLIFYYAGHGVPDESTKDAYLLPVDGIGSNAATGYKLSSLYEKLAEYPTQSTLVLLDACFSGAERSGEMMVAARGVAIKSKNEQPRGNMVVFSAAQGDETAYPYREKGHGLFTYFLCKKLQESKGNVTLGELAEFIQTNVQRHSMIENSKSQTPGVSSSGKFSDRWQNMKLIEK